MIEVRELTKVFDVKTAVNSVSFTVEKGEILGFLGPNGAGKSTTMRMITGFLPPSSGTAVIGGCDIVGDSLNARRKIGYLPENAPVYREMRVTDFLNFCAEVRGVDSGSQQARVDETIEKCFLSDVRFQTVATLSKGFKQRVCFAQSILHDPEYLIFDEPTDGLDPNQKHEVRLMIREMSAEKAIILSTHILDEVDAVCSRAIIIANGKIVADDTPQGLKATSPTHGSLMVRITAEEPNALLMLLKAEPGVKAAEILEQSDRHARIRIFPENPDAPPIADRILAMLSARSATVHSLLVEEGRLDEVFRAITTS
ncbi:Gliding motility-associated ABC transporter ATP-binding protein GldA [Olavius algarvensis associated proteobacterium Delta 3]|nr:Gliding motility-associated ABC transporter ATP-binding protein GldA [Olavius algarvensis associated proteobacterium Delta 3]CAB5126043.1 Gliding motility-associated ABC transporter ATP-binding protein GldA [Olavius algarvensis associated proteobacterium Delta 3]